MANTTRFVATGASDRSPALATAFHSQDERARPVLARLAARRSTYTAVEPTATFGNGVAPEATGAPRALLTGAVQPARTALRRKRVRSTHPGAELLQTNFPAFAAVPFGDGWLIVQL